ncbi:hypothetical protein BKA82DRAFT_28102 [Pisolithus tinctorius]|uniref:Uncharacterized protein n=1 Tax=Pisolithus tinctorius Marx 270 TaxID=870435 RepID=A0A0C3JXP5_PISTI|nr:hypothetical protein BKA82DRAFT_28102 [Pisolithus tinctorius]KIO02192.1 hypothetical protein M404DRAFT_28102 [Pisolithus tinctorius Marx 270]
MRAKMETPTTTHDEELKQSVGHGSRFYTCRAAKKKRQLTFPYRSPTPSISTTGDRLLQLSVDIFKAWELVQEIDIVAEANVSYFLQADVILSQVTSLRCRLVFSWTYRLRQTRFFALRELTLDGFCFDSSQTNSSADPIWPEFSQLTRHRLERCMLLDEDLTQILPRSNARLKCLELFDTRHPFRANNFELPNFLAGCLEELWIEDCWPFPFEFSLRLYQSLRIVHAGWDVFTKAAPFLPIGIRNISIIVPISAANSAPDYGNLEASLQSISMGLPSLETVTVSGDSEYPLLQHALGLERSLNLEGVSQGKVYLVWSRRVDLASSEVIVAFVTQVNGVSHWLDLGCSVWTSWHGAGL